MTTWYALFAPAKTPPAIIERLNAETLKILQLADIRESFLQQGLEVKSSTPEQLRSLLTAEIAKWAKVVAATGAKID